jgi:hypothetical protein
MPGSGAYPRKPVASERFGETVSFGVGHTRVRQNLDQPIAMRKGRLRRSRVGDDGIEAESLDRRVEPGVLRTGNEVEASVGHTSGVRPEVLQNLPECAGLRIDTLVVGNDLQRPQRFRGHDPPLSGVYRAEYRGRAAFERTTPDWRTVRTVKRSPRVWLSLAEMTSPVQVMTARRH